MRLISLLIFVPLLVAACSSDDGGDKKAAAPAKPAAPTISNGDADALRAQIYPHWLVPAEPPCHEQLKVLIDIAADGSVTRAEARPELGYDDPCRTAMDAAIRAVWAASPLTVPRMRKWSSLILVFDQNALH